jgi:hypothetical protein
LFEDLLTDEGYRVTTQAYLFRGFVRVVRETVRENWQ